MLPANHDLKRKQKLLRTQLWKHIVSWILWNTVLSAPGPAQHSEETDHNGRKYLKRIIFLPFFYEDLPILQANLYHKITLKAHTLTIPETKGTWLKWEKIFSQNVNTPCGSCLSERWKTGKTTKLSTAIIPATFYAGFVHNCP